MGDTSADPRIIASPPTVISLSSFPLCTRTLCDSEEDCPARVSSNSYED